MNPSTRTVAVYAAAAVVLSVALLVFAWVAGDPATTHTVLGAVTALLSREVVYVGKTVIGNSGPAVPAPPAP